MSTLHPATTLYPGPGVYPGMAMPEDGRTPIALGMITRLGLEPVEQTPGDPTSGHELDSRRADVFLEAENTDTADHTVTVLVADPDDEDLVVTVPAGETVMFGPFPSSIFNDGGGHLLFDVDDATLLLRAYRLRSA